MLIGFVGGVAIVSIMSMWALVKLIYLTAEQEQAYVIGSEEILRIWQSFVVLAALWAFWPGLANWLEASMSFIMSLL